MVALNCFTLNKGRSAVNKSRQEVLVYRTVTDHLCLDPTELSTTSWAMPPLPASPINYTRPIKAVSVRTKEASTTQET